MNKYLVQLHVYKDLFQNKYNLKDDFYVIESSKTAEEITQILNEVQALCDEQSDIRYVMFEQGFVHMEPEYYATLSVHKLGDNANIRLMMNAVKDEYIIYARD